MNERLTQQISMAVRSVARVDLLSVNLVLVSLIIVLLIAQGSGVN